MIRCLLFCFILILIFEGVSAQRRFAPDMDLGGGIAGNIYIGDLNQKISDTRNVYPGFYISTRFSRKGTFFSSFNLGYATLSEQLHDGETMTVSGAGYQASTFFSTRIYSIDYRLQYILLKKIPYSPYLKAGAGLMRFAPFDLNGVNLATNLFSRPEFEDYSVFSYYFPVGAGFQYRANPHLYLSAEYNMYLSGTDYLDNIGSNGTKQGKDYFHSIQFSVYVRISEGRKNNSFPIIADVKPDKSIRPDKHEGPAKLAQDHSKIYKSKKSLTFKDYNRKKSGTSSGASPAKEPVVAKAKAPKPEKPVVFNSYQLSESASPVLTLSAVTKETEEKNKQYLIAEKEQEYLKKNKWTPYYIQEGDSWETIAQEYGVMVEVLRKLNGAEKGSKAAVGRKIRIPKD